MTEFGVRGKEEVAYILRALPRIGHLGRLETLRLRSSLELLRECATGELHSLCDQVEELLSWSSGLEKPVREGEVRTLSDECEELRLKLVLASMEIPHIGNTVESPAEGWSAYRFRRDGVIAPFPLRRHVGDVLSAGMGNNVVILLPRIQSDTQTEVILAALLLIFDYTPPRYRWILDFSSVDHLPSQLMAALITYRRHLLAANGDLSICWLHGRLLPLGTGDRFVSLLDLSISGSYWFSSVAESTVAA